MRVGRVLYIISIIKHKYHDVLMSGWNKSRRNLLEHSVYLQGGGGGMCLFNFQKKNNQNNYLKN